VAAVFGNYLVNEGHSETKAFVLGGKKRRKNLLSLFLGHTYAVVCHA
jgi:hypothetical protein